jgi:septal ring factor EnvC (AmiA/AmiB activator)
VILIFGFTATAKSQQSESIDARLARIEEAIKATNQRLDEGLKAINQRIDDMNLRIDDMNKRIDEGLKAVNQRIEDTNLRIDDMNERFNDTNSRIDSGFNLLATLLAALIGLNAVIVGVIFWFARQDRPVSKKHYDKLIQQDEDILEQVGALENGQQELIRKQEHSTAVVERQNTERDRRLEELAEKLNKLQAEVAALKNPSR